MTSKSEKGLIVFISTGKRGRGEQVFVKWSPVGHELALLDAVQQTVDERLLVLATAAATKQDVKRFAASQAKHRSHGYWHKHTPALLSAMADMVNRERISWRTAKVKLAA